MISSENQSAEKVKYELNENKISDMGCPFKMAAGGSRKEDYGGRCGVCLSEDEAKKSAFVPSSRVCLPRLLATHSSIITVRSLNKF